MAWARGPLEELLARIDAAGPLNRDPQREAQRALEDRLSWLARAWPGTTRAERLAAALDDLNDHQRDQLLPWFETTADATAEGHDEEKTD